VERPTTPPVAKPPASLQSAKKKRDVIPAETLASFINNPNAIADMDFKVL